MAILCGLTAVGSAFMHEHFRPERRSIGIWWIANISAADRRIAESELGLTAASQKKDHWLYRLRDQSTTATAAVVTDSRVRLTQNIDRNTMKLRVDAPALPLFVQRLIENQLALPVALLSGSMCLILLGVSRRALIAATRQRVQEVRIVAVVATLTVIYVIEIWRTAWISDDAAITLRTVLNFVHGYGARFNIDERVQAYTHPLWFLLLSAVTAINSNPFAATLWLSVACSVLTFVALLLNRRSSFPVAVTVAFGLMLSKAYVDFSTSGLENPLSHLIVLATILAALRYAKDPSERWLGLSALGISAGYLNRPDLILALLPLVVFVVLRSPLPIGTMARALSVAIIPVVTWTLVATYYYGSPFPNPAYAKLGSGVPVGERLMHGATYLAHSVPRDPLTLVLVGLGVIIGLTAGGNLAAIAAGIVAYLVYVVGIGGDFMEGRFLSCVLLLAAIVLIRAPLRPAMQIMLVVCVAVLGVLGLRFTLLSSASYDDPVIAADGIADERGYYFQDYGWVNAGDDVFGPPGWQLESEDLNLSYVVCGGLGFAGINDGPAVHYIDKCGLADPLLARLPSVPISDWRVGHFERRLPLGYKESIDTETNRLVDPATRTFYESIRLVTRSPLNDPARLWEIVKLNLGLIRAPRQ